jgi:hypothetical protein
MKSRRFLLNAKAEDAGGEEDLAEVVQVMEDLVKLTLNKFAGAMVNLIEYTNPCFVQKVVKGPKCVIHFAWKNLQQILIVFRPILLTN